jgi:diketogulonate reductase-like aldo/keto reductase
LVAGLIARRSVSNLGTHDMAELRSAKGRACMTDQILYNLTRRGPEFDPLPWLGQRAIPMMAYSRVEEDRLLGHRSLAQVAAEHDA